MIYVRDSFQMFHTWVVFSVKMYVKSFQFENTTKHHEYKILLLGIYFCKFTIVIEPNQSENYFLVLR